MQEKTSLAPATAASIPCRAFILPWLLQFRRSTVYSSMPWQHRVKQHPACLCMTRYAAAAGSSGQSVWPAWRSVPHGRAS
eukprot:434-Chlamydomonas_euryale.AAC.1